MASVTHPSLTTPTVLLIVCQGTERKRRESGGTCAWATYIYIQSLPCCCAQTLPLLLSPIINSKHGSLLVYYLRSSLYRRQRMYTSVHNFFELLEQLTNDLLLYSCTALMPAVTKISRPLLSFQQQMKATSLLLQPRLCSTPCRTQPLLVATNATRGPCWPPLPTLLLTATWTLEKSMMIQEGWIPNIDFIIMGLSKVATHYHHQPSLLMSLAYNALYQDNDRHRTTTSPTLLAYLLFRKRKRKKNHRKFYAVEQ